MKYCIAYEQRGEKKRTRFLSLAAIKKLPDIYQNARIMSKSDWERLNGPINKVRETKVEKPFSNVAGTVMFLIGQSAKEALAAH